MADTVKLKKNLIEEVITKAEEEHVQQLILGGKKPRARKAAFYKRDADLILYLELVVIPQLVNNRLAIYFNDEKTPNF